ncbi:class II aldolase/adducin family protein [Pseudarthrobacter sp. WHRI 8279]|uniref:class II aldolase/adducin family protein n=1 Tax=Pseudarthrobacter sp. WHRI 8279 TaxID=3162566 RepID=UPI0035A90C5B
MPGTQPRSSTSATVCSRCCEPGRRHRSCFGVRSSRERDSNSLPPGWSVPNELPLHLAVLRSRHEMRAVVHAHPPAVVAITLVGQRIGPSSGPSIFRQCISPP